MPFRFQSPSLRGSGRFLGVGLFLVRESLVSIPFIAGQWSLPSTTGSTYASWPGFNPLHCGAVVASCRRMAQDEGFNIVSIPFIAGQWSLR